MAECRDCSGTGREEREPLVPWQPTYWTECEVCSGTGYIEEEEESMKDASPPLRPR